MSPEQIAVLCVRLGLRPSDVLEMEETAARWLLALQ